MGESHAGVPVTPQTGFGIASNTKLQASVGRPQTDRQTDKKQKLKT